METLFELPPVKDEIITETCRHCKHRARFSDYHSQRITQHCLMHPTRRNSAGYKRIKVCNPACNNFEKEE